MADPEVYEVFAVRYAQIEERFRHQNFIIADPHDGYMPIHFFVWVIRNENRTIVVDTGFDHEEGAKRNRVITRLPREGLEMLGIEAAKVENVIISHMHFDHAGTLDDFPAATFHVQELEVSYATGRHMCEPTFAIPYTGAHVISLVRSLFEGRVAFHDGDEEVAPGIVVHHIGGHTMGLQCISVFTKRGWVVLAADAAHFYENMEKPAAFPVVYSVADMLAGYKKMQGIAASPKHIVPGHDPLVMNRYPAPSADLDGYVVRLDVEPSG